MSISDLIPTLRPMVESLNTEFRFICFFILTASLILRTGTGNKSVGHLMRPIITNIFLCAIIASLPTWFNLVRDGFWNIAVGIRTEFTGSVTGTGTALMNLLQAPENTSNWLDVESSLEKAVQYALGWLIVWFAGVIQLPMMIIQYVMECLCYLFLPIAVSLFAFEGTKGLAMQYVQQTLAVLAWPIGFAVVDLVGFSLLTTTTNAMTGGSSPQGNAPIFSPTATLTGGVVAIWLILGSLSTPIIMQKLFCSGTPLSSAIGQSFQMGMAVAGMSAFLGSGGVTPPPKAPSETGGSNPSAPTPSGSPPSASPPPASPPPESSTPPALATVPSGGGSGGVTRTARGGIAVGAAADQMAPAQAQAMADQSGTSFTQAFSNGTVATYRPAVWKAQPAPSLLASLTPKPLPA